jgi:hypothetical protein
VIWVGCEADYFLSDDWTGQISLIRHDKSDFRRIGLSFGFDPMSQCMVRARVASGFAELAAAVLHQCIRPQIVVLRAIMDISAHAF